MRKLSSLTDVSIMRARTDRDLIALVDREIDRMLALAAGGTKHGDHDAPADSEYTKVWLLVAAIGEPYQAEKARLRSRLKELRLTLDRVPSQREARTLSACS